MSGQSEKKSGYEAGEHTQRKKTCPVYTEDQKTEIARLEEALRLHMAQAKPHRYTHSLSVARTAESLAMIYGVDPYLSRVAGILHDWYKVPSTEKQIELARELGIDMKVDLHLVGGLLHGILAAKELPFVFPELPDEVWQAIARHTTGAKDMTPLDMVIFVADGIEPLRRASPGIERSRSLVAKVSLEDLYWESFVGGLIYVLQTERYLYPGTLAIYNELALSRMGRHEH